MERRFEIMRESSCSGTASSVPPTFGDRLMTGLIEACCQANGLPPPVA
jgi:hypothetical protein